MDPFLSFFLLLRRRLFLLSSFSLSICLFGSPLLFVFSPLSPFSSSSSFSLSTLSLSLSLFLSLALSLGHAPPRSKTHARTSLHTALSFTPQRPHAVLCALFFLSLVRVTLPPQGVPLKRASGSFSLALTMELQEKVGQLEEQRKGAVEARDWIRVKELSLEIAELIEKRERGLL